MGYDYPIHRLDIERVYLNAPLPNDEKIYVISPEGCNTGTEYCWCLLQSVYGMKQAGHEWFHFLAKHLRDMGLVKNEIKETFLTETSNKGSLYATF